MKEWFEIPALLPNAPASLGHSMSLHLLVGTAETTPAFGVQLCLTSHMSLTPL